MSQTGIDKVTYGVKDLVKAETFWTDFGLKKIDAGNGHLTFACQNGATVEICSPDDPELPPP